MIIFNSHGFDNYKKVKVLCEQIACDERTPLDEVNSPFKKKAKRPPFVSLRCRPTALKEIDSFH